MFNQTWSHPREIDTVDTLITGPVNPAIDFDLVKLHVRALAGYDDRLLESWVGAATSFIEEQTGRQLITATREVWLDRFPGVLGTVGQGLLGTHNFSWAQRLRIELPRPPLQSVVSVQYVDGDGVLQTLVDTGSPANLLYAVKNVTQTTPTDPYQRRGWIEPLAGQWWPLARAEGGAVRIRYIAGYGDDESAVPDLLKAVLQFLVGSFDTQRAPEAFRTGFGALPMNVASILDPFERTARSTTVLR